MSTIWCIPLPGHPIFLNECPRGTNLGKPENIQYHIKWARLDERSDGTNTRLTCSCSLKHSCATYVIDTQHLRAVAHQLRTAHAPVRITTLHASVELELHLLGLRKEDQDLRPRLESQRTHIQAVA
jgi:hypothetical protein